MSFMGQGTCPHVCMCLMSRISAHVRSSCTMPSCVRCISVKRHALLLRKAKHSSQSTQTVLQGAPLALLCGAAVLSVKSAVPRKMASEHSIVKMLHRYDTKLWSAFYCRTCCHTCTECKQAVDQCHAQTVPPMHVLIAPTCAS